MKPIIGITCDYDWKEDKIQLKTGYVKSVCRAGGLPFLISPVLPHESGMTADIISRIDGLLLTGGQDVDPRHFGDEPHKAIGFVNPWRDELELSLCREAAKARMPILGICRGAQVLNIALGGDIFQDINAQAGGKGLICHSQTAPAWYGFHSIKIREGSRLHGILGTDDLFVNSFHHQAVRRLAPTFEAAAFTSDGMIEAVESREHPFMLGVQWHPECMQEDPFTHRLFEAFVKAAGRPAGDE
jgi:putative glutamine amidotransferase